MPTISVSADRAGLLFSGAHPLGMLSPGSALPLPVRGAPPTLVFLPADGRSCAEAYPLVLHGPDLFLSGGPGTLARRSREIYELFLSPPLPRSFRPPILLCETRWGSGWAGLCGDWFVWETGEGAHRSHENAVTAFTVLSAAFVLLRDGGSVWVIDSENKTILPRTRVKEASVADGILTLRFCPGGLRFFEITQRFDAASMQCRASELHHGQPKSAFETVACFCEAVRLGAEDEAMAMLSPGLRAMTDFAGIRDFFGPFDACEPPRFVPCGDTDAALRYVVDERNVHYRLFSFALAPDGERKLIDDITEDSGETGDAGENP